MKRNLLQLAFVVGLAIVLTGCSGGAVDNTNGQVGATAPKTANDVKGSKIKPSMVGVSGGLYQAAPGQPHGIPK